MPRNEACTLVIFIRRLFRNRLFILNMSPCLFTRNFICFFDYNFYRAFARYLSRRKLMIIVTRFFFRNQVSNDNRSSCHVLSTKEGKARGIARTRGQIIKTSTNLLARREGWDTLWPRIITLYVNFRRTVGNVSLMFPIGLIRRTCHFFIRLRNFNDLNAFDFEG